PATGALVLATDGSFTYTAPAPVPGFTTSFTYRAQDPTTLLSNIATVTISLLTNSAPVTSPGIVFVAEDVPKTVNFPVTDSTNDPLTITITRQPTMGTLTLVNNSTPIPQFTFTPLANVSGADSFSFSVTDGTFTATGDVSVTITPVNDAPTATSTNYEVGLNSFVNALLVGGDAADGTAVTFSIVTPPTRGSVTITDAATGAFRYTPNVGYLGLDSFTFKTNDGVLDSIVATATIEAKPAPLFTSTPVIAPNPLLALQLLTGTAAANNGSISWNWGDGTSTDGASVTHTYATTGVFAVVTTITATTGLKTTFTQVVYVGAPVNGGGATPGGIVVGGDNPSGGTGAGTGKIVCNYVKREKSTYSGSLKGLMLPPTLTQGDLVGKSGVLVIGVGSPNAFSVPFTLSPQGRAKSTGLPSMKISVKKGSFSFKAQASILTELTESLGGTRQFTKTVTPVVLNVPVTIQVGTQIFIVLTFQMKYNQSGNGGKGGV
ncbi:MAG: Ig-like domain-containing protein, partial [bacterium]|nr:Ig-like domain-containing protein [bacterium]